jgi:hypothetical protein
MAHPSPPIVILSRFPTPAPNKALQPFWSAKAHEMVGVLDDNLCVYPALRRWWVSLRFRHPATLSMPCCFGSEGVMHLARRGVDSDVPGLLGLSFGLPPSRQ